MKINLLLTIIGLLTLVLAQDRRLVHETVIHRHGCRAPLKWLPGPAEYEYDTPFVKGELTTRGQLQHFALGREQRTDILAKSHLTDVDDAIELLTAVYSTQSRRTAASAGAHASGAFGYDTLPPNAPSLVMGGYAKSGNLPKFKSCKTLKTIIADAWPSQEQELIKQYEPVISRLSLALGQPITSFGQLKKISGTLQYADTHYLPLPGQVEFEDADLLFEIRDAKTRSKFDFKRIALQFGAQGVDIPTECRATAAAAGWVPELVELAGADLDTCVAATLMLTMHELEGSCGDSPTPLTAAPQLRWIARLRQMYAGAVWNLMVDELSAIAHDPSQLFRQLAEHLRNTEVGHFGAYPNSAISESPPLYSEFSSHDSTLILLLEALGLHTAALEQRTPNMADMLRFEVWCNHVPSTADDARSFVGTYSDCTVTLFWNRRRLNTPLWVTALAAAQSGRLDLIAHPDADLPLDLFINAVSVLTSRGLYAETMCSMNMLFTEVTTKDVEWLRCMDRKGRRKALSNGPDQPDEQPDDEPELPEGPDEPIEPEEPEEPEPEPQPQPQPRPQPQPEPQPQPQPDKGGSLRRRNLMISLIPLGSAILVIALCYGAVFLYKNTSLRSFFRRIPRHFRRQGYRQV